MKRKKAEKPKKKVRQEPSKAEVSPPPPADEDATIPGVLPDRDLKKNLGC